MKTIVNRKKLLFAVTIFTAFVAVSCSRYVIILDKPDYHYQNGQKLLSEGNLEGAKIEFEYAVFLDKDFAPARVGLAIVYGTLGDLNGAVEQMQKAQEIYQQDRQRP